MRDRTKELGNQDSDHEDESSVMIKPGSSSAKEDETLKKVKEIREVMEALKRKVSELENKQKEVLGMVPSNDDMKRELQTLREEIKTLANQIQKKLKSIESKTGEEDGKYVPISLRMQRASHGVLSREFVELMGHCNTIQTQYRQRNMEMMKRQLKITKTDVTDEQLEAMIENGETAVFTQNLLHDAIATKKALNEIESRHDEIIKLEKSIRELHGMFSNLAVDVANQGEVINRIETHITNSSDYVEKAKVQMEQAASYKSKARNKKMWIALCCAIFILILVISLVITFSS